MLDFTLSQKIGYGFGVKLSAKNILNSKIEKTIDFNNTEYVFHSYTPGRNFSLGVSYSL